MLILLGFRSYLWGIETTIRRVNSRHVSRFRSYLWGIETSEDYVWGFWKRGFRSYLWGIETPNSKVSTKNRRASSDLTYEGLKHLYCLATFLSDSSSDLTYEGLKLSFLANAIWRCVFRSDLTYEGLKLITDSISFWKLSLFRSYLWGIETCLRVLVSSRLLWFRSYLWGIETCFNT